MLSLVQKALSKALSNCTRPRYIVSFAFIVAYILHIVCFYFLLFLVSCILIMLYFLCFINFVLTVSFGLIKLPYQAAAVSSKSEQKFAIGLFRHTLQIICPYW